MSKASRDFVTDQNPATLVRGVMSGANLPDYTETGWPSASELDGLQKFAFADPDNRLHPVHTKAATFLSAVYAANADVPVADCVPQNLRKAAAVHGIEKDVEPLLAQIEQNKQTSKVSTDVDVYALRDGTKAFYPLGTRVDLRKSASSILDDLRYNLLPVQHVRTACEALVKRAGELKYALEDLPADVVRMGRRLLPDTEALRKQADWRERITGDALYKEAVELYAADRCEETLCACAEAWHQLDDAYNVKASNLTPSVLTCWCAGIPESEVKQACKDTVWFGDQPVPAGVLTTVPRDMIESWYAGESLAKVAAVQDAAYKHGFEASDLLDAMSQDERAVLADHLRRYHQSR